MRHPILTLHMSSGALIKLELYPEAAPNTVSSVVNTALAGKYNGSEFYRVVKGFVLQTGCSEHDSYNMYSSYKINGEFKANGFIKEQPIFDVGVVGMCGVEPNTSDRTSFFIMTGDLKNRDKSKPSLNDNYAAIGRVVEGLQEVMRINELETHNVDYNGITFNTPRVPQIIEKITVETFEESYVEPQLIEYGAQTKAKIKAMGELLKSIK